MTANSYGHVLANVSILCIMHSMSVLFFCRYFQGSPYRSAENSSMLSLEGSSGSCSIRSFQWDRGTQSKRTKFVVGFTPVSCFLCFPLAGSALPSTSSNQSPLAARPRRQTQRHTRADDQIACKSAGCSCWLVALPPCMPWGCHPCTNGSWVSTQISSSPPRKTKVAPAHRRRWRKPPQGPMALASTTTCTWT